MAETAKEVSTNGLADTKRTPRLVKRRNWPEAFKRQVVAETLEAGSSVSMVARRHDVNANQLFKWRREMLPEDPAPPRWRRPDPWSRDAGASNAQPQVLADGAPRSPVVP